MAQVKIVLKLPGELAHAREIDNSLHALTALVGGYLELILFPVIVGDRMYSLDFWCNDAGRRLQLAPNVALAGVGTILGPVFVSQREEGEIASLSQDEAEIVISCLNRSARSL